jgi:N-methylhydantoinase B/oxoprolinase/acetone carboxylase alpha subunit
METAYNFAIGAVIGTLMLGSHGNVSPWGVLAGALATGVVNVIAQHEFRRYSKKQTKRKLKKSLRTPMRKEIRRNVKGGKTGKPKKGKSVANFVKTDVNEGRLIPRKASDKLCKRLKVKNQKTRDAVWAYLNGEAWKICIRWNMQRTYMQKKI